MKSFFQKLNANKSKKLAIALAVALSAATFAGCSLGSSTTPAKSSSSSAQQTQQANLDNLSDARNTPTVRAAAAVGPSVVGITNKAVARDFFNNPVESQGVGSGVIFKNDGGKSYIVTNNHVVDGASELIVSCRASSSVLMPSLTSPSCRSMTATCRQPTSATPTRRSSASPSLPSATRWALSSRAA